MQYYKNILETIGDTPLVKLNSIVKDLPCTVLAKVETTNPGNSVKDRMALQMIEDAEAEGKLKPGGTIIEGTSGNTGMGLALAAIIKGYKLVCTLSDKQSKEKMDILRAMGAEVIVCPTNVEPTDPRSYYMVAKRMTEETPNSIYIDQYNNLSNRKAHYLTTGPEIWEQTDGKITHFVVGVGTGGTVSGVGKYLKEQNKDVKVWGIDTYGSVFKKYHETGVFDKNEIYPYITEGIGEDILPENVDFSVIDHFEKVSDKDGAIMARRLAREEGIFVGYSAGSAVAGIMQMADKLTKDDVVVVLFHDHGSRYVGKLFNDDWMRDRGFLENPKITANDLINRRGNQPLIQLNVLDPVDMAVDMMTRFNISQVPIVKEGEYVGSLNDNILFARLMENPDLKSSPIESIMEKPFPIVNGKQTIKEIAAKMGKDTNAVVVEMSEGEYHIVTKHDLIGALS